jgi:putative methionine-R-sulfoxide reductase with GAF domain
MSAPLADLDDCFEGVIPSVVATLDAAGEPNVSYLSQVYRVDDTHLALSNQFFSKTAANVKATGRARLLVVSGRTGAQHLLDMVHVGSLREGELFGRMAAQLSAFASHLGTGEAMALRSAELYRVETRQTIWGPPTPAAAPLRAARDVLALSARISVRLAGLSDANAMIDLALDGLTESLGYSNVMLLVASEGDGRLTTLASRGYPTGGAGAEMQVGDGVIGITAATGYAVRVCDMSRGQRMAAAVNAATASEQARHIPLPGLAQPYSQLAAPMISQGVLHGVLFAESPDRFAFTAEDEAALTLIGTQLAASLRLADTDAEPAAPAEAPPAPSPAGPELQVRAFAFDDSVFIGDDYIIKGVAGRLLLHFLDAYAATGRRDFTNREIRLEPSLKLPGYKDNLETRLILLKRRLDERGAQVRLDRPERGRIRLVLEGEPRLTIRRLA